MSNHRYGIGERVRLTTSNIRSTSPRDVFRIVAALPEQDNLVQYRIRNDTEGLDQVASEDCLVAIEMHFPPQEAY